MVSPVFKYLQPYTPPLAAGSCIDVALHSDEGRRELDCNFDTIIHPLVGSKCRRRWCAQVGMGN